MLTNMGLKTWLYVLKCSMVSPKYGPQTYFYVGMTYRLGNRMREHSEGRGAQCTSKWSYNELVALYKISDSQEHIQELETKLTLQIMKLKRHLWWQVRGAQWCKHHNVKPTRELDAIKEVDVCTGCGYPTMGTGCPKTILRWAEDNMELDQEVIWECGEEWAHFNFA